MHSNIDRRKFLKMTSMGAVAMTLPLTGCVQTAFFEKIFKLAPKRPNMLFIMSDDHAAKAISSYGSILADYARTPNIDRLAQEGNRLENCFCTNSICTPSRAAILTGQYSHINGVNTLQDDFDRDRSNVAKLLQSSGYQTAMIGKWHLHTEPSGFDYYNVLPGQGLYHDPLLKEKGKPWKKRNAGGEVYPGYVTDVITDEALKWLENRDTEQPFFMMCHHKAPHGRWEYAKRHEHLFDGITIPEPASLFEDKSHRSIATQNYGSTLSSKNPIRNRVARMTDPKKVWPTGMLETEGLTQDEITRAAYQKYLKDYLRCCIAVDENVGRMLDYLDENNLSENTIVIYTSDQGMMLGEHDLIDKRWMFEESLQMPFLIRYPKEIEGGSRNQDISLNIDFAPTFLDYAGVPVPTEVQGKSIRSNLQGKTPDDWRQSMYYRYWMHRAHHDIPGHYGIRTKQHKLIFYHGLPLDANGAKQETSPVGWELYDMIKDPHELQNVYKDPTYQAVIPKLKAELLKLKQQYADTDEKYPELMAVRKSHWD